MKAFPRWRFEKPVKRHRADHRIRHLSSGTMLMTMAFAQLSGSRSLREVVGALERLPGCHALLGLQPVRRSTLADANRQRPAALFEDVNVVYDPGADAPVCHAVTSVRTNDITPAKRFPVEPGATYVFDRGYYDFGFWNALDAKGCRFVTRLASSRRNTLDKPQPHDQLQIPFAKI